MPSGRDTNQIRLIKVTPKAFEEGSVELHFVYDYHGRRISKERRTYNPASMKFEFEKRIEYIFDGWNVILEKTTEGRPATEGNTILTKRYWGLGLGDQANEGSPDTAASAGGVGGLLATFATKSSPATAGTETHYFHYDANGNVTETVDSNGDLTASYEYGPFGELVSETGSYLSENTYKFSTKPQDEETGYYYYGFRYYDSANGRWLNRDPLGESGYEVMLQQPFMFYNVEDLLLFTEFQELEVSFIELENTQIDLSLLEEGDLLIFQRIVDYYVSLSDYFSIEIRFSELLSEGGNNYCFIVNDGINKVDLLGNMGLAKFAFKQLFKNAGKAKKACPKKNPPKPTSKVKDIDPEQEIPTYKIDDKGNRIDTGTMKYKDLPTGSHIDGSGKVFEGTMKTHGGAIGDLKNPNL